jgi:acetyltransferase-like isoleucine patch superfamily enzyme
MNLLKKIVNKIIQIFFKKKYSPLIIIPTDNLSVGKMSYHNGNFNFRGDQKGIIGSYCAFGKNVTVMTSNHDYNFPSIQGTFYSFYFDEEHPGVSQMPPNKERTKGAVFIGSDVWIADNVTILSGVRIGDGACIGNNSIVTKDVDAFSIVAGIPAREIKKRFDLEKIDFFKELQWWNWDVEKINRNKLFFMTDINKVTLNFLKKIIK